MARRISADPPLHTGRGPPRLFDRVVELGGAIAEAVVEECGRDELLRRLSDPYWFRALGCVPDSTGTLRGSRRRWGAEGGALPSSRCGELDRTSRMSAAVDNGYVHDTYLYHHARFVALPTNRGTSTVPTGSWYLETARGGGYR